MTSSFQARKQELWTSAENAVREHLSRMPEQHRARLKEVAESEFAETVLAIKEIKERFKKADDLATCRSASERYAVLSRDLCKDVSLFLLGVKKKKPG